jgi:hypothetical protein
MGKKLEPFWETVAEKTTDWWLEVHNPVHMYRASVKSTGCIHFYQDYPADDDGEYLHICDIDDLIERLQELKVRAELHFGEDWNK